MQADKQSPRLPIQILSNSVYLGEVKTFGESVGRLVVEKFVPARASHPNEKLSLVKK